MRGIGGKWRIKVAYVMTPIDFGGAEKVSLNFLKNFNTNNFEIVPFILIRPWEDKVFFVNEIEKAKIKYLTIPVANKPAVEGRDYFRIVRCYRILLSFLMRGGFDIIHTHGYFADILGIPLSKICRIPHMSTCHGFIQNDTKLKLYNWLDASLLKYSNKIISVADGIKDRLMISGVKEDNIVTIKNAVTFPKLTVEEIKQKRISVRQRYNINREEVFIGYIGRLSEEKGIRYLLKAGSILRRQALSIKIVLIGEGPERERLEELSCKEGLTQQVIFAGFQKDAVSLLPALDIFVLPSLTEGTPMAILEAMSYGLPIVASRVGDLPKIISHEEDGILIDPGDSQGIGEGILQIVKDKDLKNNISVNAKRKIVTDYDIKSWCKKIENQYISIAFGK